MPTWIYRNNVNVNIDKILIYKM